MNPRRAAALLTAYLVLGAADTVLAATDPDTAWRWATKPLLMPVLLAFVVASAPRTADLRLPRAALVGGWVGDTALLIGGTPAFMAGMLGFAAGHVAYVTAFRRAGALTTLRDRRAVPVVYGLLWGGMMATLWTRLYGLAVPVLVYSLLLTTMAVLAAGMRTPTAVGGALFLLSDSLIALDLAKAHLFPGQNALIMPLYVAAQLLLMLTWVRLPRRATAPTPTHATA